MDFMWKGKVIKAILQKEKFDMPPSTASLEKDLSSDDKRTKQTKKKKPWWKQLLYSIWSSRLL